MHNCIGCATKKLFTLHTSACKDRGMLVDPYPIPVFSWILDIRILDISLEAVGAVALSLIVNAMVTIPTRASELI